MRLFKRKRKNKNKPKLFYIERDTIPRHCEYNMEPLDSPFLLHTILEALKPPSLPEQKVFNSVDELIDSL